MSSKQPPGDGGNKQPASPLFGKQSSKDILADASGSSAKSPYAVARPQPAAAARGGNQGELYCYVYINYYHLSHIYESVCLMPQFHAMQSNRIATKHLRQS